MLSIVWPDKLRRILARLLDETEFLSPYGHALALEGHERQPYTLNVAGMCYGVDYEPAESTERHRSAATRTGADPSGSRSTT